MTTYGRPLPDLDDSQLVTEWQHWVEQVDHVTEHGVGRWGPTLELATELRNNCAAEISGRGIQAPAGA